MELGGEEDVEEVFIVGSGGIHGIVQLLLLPSVQRLLEVHE